MNPELLVNISSPGEPLIEREEFSDDITLVEFWLSQLHETINIPLNWTSVFLPNQKHFDQYIVL